MNPQPRDTYRVQCSFDISNEIIQRLSLLYLPLIGVHAFSLYLTLAAESIGSTIQQTHDRLFALLCNPAEKDFDKACARLEEYHLLRIFEKAIEKRKMYIYILEKPIKPESFRHSHVLSQHYISYLGSKNYENTLARLLKAPMPLADYREVTRANIIQDLREIDDEVEFTKVKPRFSFEDDETISFDYDQFLAKATPLTFPIELRTQENMALIGRLATVYGLSADKMRLIVKECVNLSDISLNTEALAKKARGAKSDVAPTEDPYAMDPRSFLQSRQHGAAVTLADKMLLENLSLNMHFKNEVINVMIEYILSISANRLNPRFVDMVAGEWAREGIATKEQALLKTKQEPPGKKKKPRQAVPDYIREQEADSQQTSGNQKIDPRKLEEYRRLIKENNNG